MEEKRYTDRFVEKSLENTVDFLHKRLVKLSNSLFILNIVGYGFLLFSLLDLIFIIFPHDFTNPVWEFDFVGTVVERVAAPLIGFGLVFLGDQGSRSKWEQILLTSLSWICLATVLFYIVIFLLGISSTLRVDRLNNQQISKEARLARSQIQTTQEQVRNTDSPEQLAELLTSSSNLNQPISLENTEQFQNIKKEFSQFLEKEEKSLPSRVKKQIWQQRRILIKNSLKRILGSLLSSALFFCIWRQTRL